MPSLYETDLSRGLELSKFQKYLRLLQDNKSFFMRPVYRLLYKYYSGKCQIEIYPKTKIGKGFYIGHPFGIVINPATVIGDNCSIHGSTTIGQENRGPRKGTPIIGNKVWIGMHTTIVGGIRVGNDVLIAPNTFVNRDIPDHSVVFGNPCIIKHNDNATEEYIKNVYEE